MSRQSIEAARIIWEHLNSAVGARDIMKMNQTIKRVEILEPARENVDWGNAAIVVHLADGTRYGMEVCPFPVLHQLHPRAPIADEQHPEGA